MRASSEKNPKCPGNLKKNFSVSMILPIQILAVKNNGTNRYNKIEVFPGEKAMVTDLPVLKRQHLEANSSIRRSLPSRRRTVSGIWYPLFQALTEQSWNFFGSLFSVTNQKLVSESL